VIDVPPSASPSVARAVTAARKLVGATYENTGAATRPVGGSSPPTPKAQGLEPLARTRPSSRPS
jgi:hypothetical protein